MENYFHKYMCSYLWLDITFLPQYISPLNTTISYNKLKYQYFMAFCHERNAFQVLCHLNNLRLSAEQYIFDEAKSSKQLIEKQTLRR